MSGPRNPSNEPESVSVRRYAREPSQVYAIRIPESRLEEFRRLAESEGEQPASLMREWVLERLDQEVAARGTTAMQQFSPPWDAVQAAHSWAAQPAAAPSPAPAAETPKKAAARGKKASAKTPKTKTTSTKSARRSGGSTRRGKR